MRISIINRKEVFRGKLLRVLVDRVELDGRQVEREWVEFPETVAILALRDDRVVMVRQYRHPTGQVLLELPAGKVDPNESPAEAARRELLEETGFWAEGLSEVAKFWISPGYTSERMTLFFAPEVKPAGEFNPDEITAVELVSLCALRRMLKAGGIHDSKTLMGVLWLLGGFSR